MKSENKCPHCGHAKGRHFTKYGDEDMTCSVNNCNCIILRCVIET